MKKFPQSQKFIHKAVPKGFDRTSDGRRCVFRNLWTEKHSELMFRRSPTLRERDLARREFSEHRRRSSGTILGTLCQSKQF